MLGYFASYSPIIVGKLVESAQQNKKRQGESGLLWQY